MSSPSVLQDARQLTPRWLMDLAPLRQASDAAEVTIEEIPGHSSAVRVKLTGVAGLPDHLIFKVSNRLPGTARAEALFYSELVPAMSDPPVPSCYHVSFDLESGTANLLLQDTAPTHDVLSATDRVPLPAVTAMVDTLAAIHGSWWQSPRLDHDDLLRPMEWLFVQQATGAQHIESHCRRFEQELLPACGDAFGDDGPPGWQDLCEQAVRGWPNLFIARTREGRGLTLTHYDPHPMNFSLPRDGAGQVLLGDWEGCTRGVGTFDASFLLTVYSTVWPDPEPAQVPRLLQRYHGQLVDNGVDDYSWEQCLLDYRLSLVGYLLRTMIWRDPTRMKSAIQLFEEHDCGDLL